MFVSIQLLIDYFVPFCITSLVTYVYFYFSLITLPCYFFKKSNKWQKHTQKKRKNCGIF